MAGWLRQHNARRGHDPVVVALARQEAGRSWAIVNDGTPSTAPYRSECGDIESAKKKADAMVLEAYPHDCIRKCCAAWVLLGGPG